MVGIFDQSDTTENLAARKDVASPGTDELAQTVDAESVNRQRALLLAEANERHLHQAALVAAVKVRVRLDPVNENHARRLEHIPIHEHAER